MYTVEDGRTNPFLHLSMHLSISEQCSIDQPAGIRQAVELLVARRDSLHEGGFVQHAPLEVGDQATAYVAGFSQRARYIKAGSVAVPVTGFCGDAGLSLEGRTLADQVDRR